MANEPGQAVLAIFDSIIDRIKSTRPLRSDNKPLETGFVYSQLVLGMMVDPDDFKNPWTPMQGATVRRCRRVRSRPSHGRRSAGGRRPARDERIRRADGPRHSGGVQHVSARGPPDHGDEGREPTGVPGGGRTVSFAYEGIINGMQPLPAPPLSPEIQKQIDDAQKVLHELDAEGNIVGKTKLYQNYVKNARTLHQRRYPREIRSAIALRVLSPNEAGIYFHSLKRS